MKPLSFYLDKRRVRKDGMAMIKIRITHGGKSFFVGTNVFVPVAKNCWDGERVRNIPNSMALNLVLSNKRQQIEDVILDLERGGELEGLSAQQLHDLIAPERHQKGSEGSFVDYYRKFVGTHTKPKTIAIYEHTLTKVLAFLDRAGGRGLNFDDITKDWLTRFNNWLAETCAVNTCHIHLRNIRAVFNYAIDNDVTQNYPFRKFKLKTAKTRKRSLSVEDLRVLFGYECEPERVKYVDMFKLIFMLIGINTVDLMGLKEVRNGRIEFVRAKTGRPYSIKVEPEAMELIERYRGRDLLLRFAESYRNYEDFRNRLNRELKKIGPVEVGKRGKKVRQPLFPDISTYWARHSWATVAASLDIPKETIAAALGHGGNTVTDIYIAFDDRKIDEANRRVLDWVLYGKR